MDVCNGKYTHGTSMRHPVKIFSLKNHFVTRFYRCAYSGVQGIQMKLITWQTSKDPF